MSTDITKTVYTDAVIIPHYNDLVRLRKCLSALLKNDIANTEIVVVDNASSTPVDNLREEFSTVRFIIEHKKGAAEARNTGVRETTAPRLFFIDADCIPAKDWLAVGRKVSDKADLIGGRVDVFDETPPPRTGSEAFEAVFAFNFKRYIEVQGFSGAGNLITRRDVFEKIGGFKNGVSEDREWTMRAVAHGFRLVYEDTLRVKHPSRQNWTALKQKWKRTTREAFLLNGTGLFNRLKWAFRAMLMPASIVAHIPKIILSDKLSSPGEYLRAIMTLGRLRTQRMIWMLKQAAGLEP